jgi:hypothetical protein
MMHQPFNAQRRPETDRSLRDGLRFDQRTVEIALPDFFAATVVVKGGAGHPPIRAPGVQAPR